jgi:dolichol-phosphate mannosyltransferase
MEPAEATRRAVKAWGLEIGLRASDPAVDWVVTVDADVRCGPSAIARVVSFAECEEIPFLSVACRQIARSAGLSMVHPSLLTSLVYRFGIPGHRAHTLEEVQSNGQFAVYARDPLLQAGGFAVAQASTCEDVTLARHLFLSGYDVGFYDGEHLAETEMHSGMVDCLRNWPRSLNLRDRFRPMAGIEGLANMVFLQVIPLVIFATSLRSPGVTHPIVCSIVSCLARGLACSPVLDVPTEIRTGRTGFLHWRTR